jgi:PAS domain S-box-containing protein
MTIDGKLAAQPADLAGPDQITETTPGTVAAILSTDDILGRVETAIIVVDHDGCLRYANEFAASLYGYPDARQLTDVEFRDLGFDEEDLPKVDHLERQACRGKDWEGTLSIRRRDGSTAFLRMTASALRGPAGEVDGTVIMARPAVQLGMEPGVGMTGLLDRIGQQLTSTLELDQTLTGVSETLVPQFADHCFIDLYESEGLVRHLTRRVHLNARSWEPPDGTWPLVGDRVRYSVGHFCRRAIEDNEVVMIEDIDDQESPAQTWDSYNVNKQVGLTSVIAAPLTARGQRLGVMCLALSSLTPRDTHHYNIYDRDLFAAIASRVAIAIDNAMLFEEERDTAVAIQKSLLPPSEPPHLDGLEIAYSYVPAEPLSSHAQGIQTQVGGDWYDIIPLSAGRVGIVIGDVEGRGARAAAVMGQLRSALRAFAQDDKAPADILRRLDEWCRAMKDERDDSGLDWPIVSCTYLIYDPWYRKLTIANAGHMSPLIICDGQMQQMEIEEGVLLGVRGIFPGLPPYREESRDLAPGSTLIFYTDGLVDRRQRADGDGKYDDDEVFDMLKSAVEAVASQGIDQIVNAAQQAVPGQIDDDMAILAIRTSQEDLQKWEMPFPAEPIRVSEARKVAFDTFVECGMDDAQADLACLLVSEVVTNVVLHTSVALSPRHDYPFDGAIGSGRTSAMDDWADSPFADDFPGPGGEFGMAQRPEFMLRIRKGQESVWVEVLDSDLRLPRIRMAGENDEGGRGLYLVDQIAERWGSRPTEEGKAVWFEMLIRPASAAALSGGSRPQH